MKYEKTMETAVGTLCVTEEDGAITGLRWGEGGDDDTPLLRKAEKQLDEYFYGKRRTFKLPLKPKGTEFQMKVWDALLKIPYGKVCSYQAVAEAIGNPKAVRAVGNANNRNPIPIMIPCHRVIASDGTMGGYAPGIDKKILLLELETVHAKPKPPKDFEF